MKSNTKARTSALETRSDEKSTLGNAGLDPQVRIEDVGNGLGQESNCPHCGENVEQVDSFADSQTVRCIQCGQCALIKSSPTIRMIIPLVDFHIKRGTGDLETPLDDLSVAEELVECLSNDRWPSMDTADEFGIDSSSHLGALRSAYWGGCNVYDLDRVLGDGRAITQLIRAVPEQRYPDVRFFTMYDGWRCCFGRTEWLEDGA